MKYSLPPSFLRTAPKRTLSIRQVVSQSILLLCASLPGIAQSVGPTSSSPLQFGTIPFGTTEVILLTITNSGVPGTITLGTWINGPSYKVLTTSQNT